MLQRLETPVTANLEPSAVSDNWAGYGANAYVAYWNTNNVTSDEVPRTLEEVFDNFEGRLLMEDTDWDWMATLITEWFVPVEGMTEEEAIELFRRAAQNAAVVRGHTFMNSQVISGEFDISASSYVNRSQGDVQDGASVAWEPAVEPGRGLHGRLHGRRALGRRAREVGEHLSGRPPTGRLRRDRRIELADPAP